MGVVTKWQKICAHMCNSLYLASYLETTLPSAKQTKLIILINKQTDKNLIFPYRIVFCFVLVYEVLVHKGLIYVLQWDFMSTKYLSITEKKSLKTPGAGPCIQAVESRNKIQNS